MGKRNPSAWNKAYRLSLMEDESHKRVRTFHFSKLSGILVAAIALVLILGLAYLLLAFTPLRHTIPGYPDGESKRAAIRNALAIDSLENEMTRWSLYASNLARVLSGEESLTADSLLASNPAGFLEELSAEELARRDSILKSTVTREEQFGVSDNKRILPLEGMHFFTPLKGTVTQAFDLVLHPAVDITAPANSVVCATLDGTVILADWTDDAGYTIAIQHEGGLISFYKHTRKLLKNSGDKVKAGTPVSLIGNSRTGADAAGDHLHFEIWYNGEAVNPEKFCTF